MLQALTSNSPVAEVLSSATGALADAAPVGQLDFEEIKRMPDATFAEAASYRTCVDYTSGPLSASLVGVAGPVNCSNLFSSCHLPNATAIRMLCPVTCRCGSSDLFPGILATMAFGCPQSCLQLQKYRYFVKDSHAFKGHYFPPCNDHTPLYGVNNLDIFLRSVFEYMAFIKTQFTVTYLMTAPDLAWVKNTSAVLDSLFNGSSLNELHQGRWHYAPGLPHPRGLTGCAFLASPETIALWQVDLCQTGTFKSIRKRCSYSCGCVGGMEECPTMCMYGFLGLGFNHTDPKFYNP